VSQPTPPGPFNLQSITELNEAGQEPAEMYPQTVHIRDWRAIWIEFKDGQAFC